MPAHPGRSSFRSNCSSETLTQQQRPVSVETGLFFASVSYLDLFGNYRFLLALAVIDVSAASACQRADGCAFLACGQSADGCATQGRASDDGRRFLGGTSFHCFALGCG